MSTTLSRKGNFQFPVHLLTGSLERRTEQRYIKANNSNITVGLFFQITGVMQGQKVHFGGIYRKTWDISIRSDKTLDTAQPCHLLKPN